MRKEMMTFGVMALMATSAIAGYNDGMHAHQELTDAQTRGLQIRQASDNTLNSKFDITTPVEREMEKDGYLDTAYVDTTRTHQHTPHAHAAEVAANNVITDYDDIPNEGKVVAAGIVTDIDMFGNEFTMKSGTQVIDVESSRELALKEGDKVLVNGVIDYDWGEREISASTIVDPNGKSLVR